MESVPCDLCDNERLELVLIARDTNYGLDGAFPIVRCLNCGLVYQNPRPSPSEIEAFYPSNSYHPFKALFRDVPPDPAPLHKKRAEFLTTSINPGRMLDVGCGSGLFLVAMRQLGWICEGVEPNRNAAEFAVKCLQLQVLRGDIFSKEPPQKYDLITFWDVLEHTHSPKKVLRHAKTLLRPGGFLALNVPNWGGIERKLFRERWIAIDAPRHLYHFTPETLRKMLDQCGFEPVMIKAQASSLSLSSNLLRWAGDNFLRGGRSKFAQAGSDETSNKVPKRSWRHLLIGFTRLMMTFPNAATNLINQGAGITVVAKISSKR